MYMVDVELIKDILMLVKNDCPIENGLSQENKCNNDCFECWLKAVSESE